MRAAPGITLDDEERKTLMKWAGGRNTPAKDAPRPGRKPALADAVAAEIVRKTTQETPVGATHWSVRTMAAAVGVGKDTVRRVWKAAGLNPHLCRTFKVFNDPNFTEKLVDVVGLYLNPHEKAIRLCVDEKSRIQALDRTQKNLPIYPARRGTPTHDYKRDGTTTLFAALNAAEGVAISERMPRHRRQEWIKFLKRIDESTPPDVDLDLIVDNYATHKYPKVLRWLARRPRFHVHFIPTSSSWLNLVERFFRDLAEKRLRRGVLKSVAHLEAAIGEYIERRNDAGKGFVWTAKTEDILEKVRRARAVLDKIPSE